MTVRNHHQSGFGILQLLVVIAACGLLSSLVILISGGFRERTRDARRISDMNQLRQGLELYYNTANGYPDTSNWLVGHDFICQGNDIMKIPKDPLPQFIYTYRAIGKSGKGCGDQVVWSAYQMQFETESNTILGPAGVYCLTPMRGFTAGACLLK